MGAILTTYIHWDGPPSTTQSFGDLSTMAINHVSESWDDPPRRWSEFLHKVLKEFATRLVDAWEKVNNIFFPNGGEKW